MYTSNVTMDEVKSAKRALNDVYDVLVRLRVPMAIRDLVDVYRVLYLAERKLARREVTEHTKIE